MNIRVKGKLISRVSFPFEVNNEIFKGAEIELPFSWEDVERVIIRHIGMKLYPQVAERINQDLKSLFEEKPQEKPEIERLEHTNAKESAFFASDNLNKMWDKLNELIDAFNGRGK